MLRLSEGSDRVVIYLEAERAKKVLPVNWSVSADSVLVERLSEKLGEKNVKVVEKTIEKIGKMNLECTGQNALFLKIFDRRDNGGRSRWQKRLRQSASSPAAATLPE